MVVPNNNNTNTDSLISIPDLHLYDEKLYMLYTSGDLNEDYKPTYPWVIKLSDNDARIIKETFVSPTDYRYPFLG